MPIYTLATGHSIRRYNQEAFLRDDARVISATIAFGMGINKTNVRLGKRTNYLAAVLLSIARW
jgi:superfamily II DNA helicase RecQ